MKRFIALIGVLAICVGLPALANPPKSGPLNDVQTCTAGTCTRPAPTSTAEGMSLYSVRGYRYRLCAAAGQTLSGGGSLQFYRCQAFDGRCSLNPLMAMPVPAAAAGQPCVTFPSIPVPDVSYELDTVVIAASGVTVSGGANVTVRMVPFAEKAGG